MLRASKMFKWEMAHMLTNHKGACANVHGHSYKMEVIVSRNSNSGVVKSGSSEGMVADFSDIKSAVMPLVDALDHAFMYNTHVTYSAEADVVAVLEKHGLKLYAVDYRPTAENMAQDFFFKIQDALFLLDTQLKLETIKVWETDTAYAEYKE
ncbi:MAG: 6-pyruvoyl trahydropterin synthase family protein [Paraclostridium sp.]